MKFLYLFLFSATFVQAQTPTDSQLLLNEVRQLRQDLANSSATLQRTQILLFRLQLEESAMTRATQRLDQAKAQLSSVQMRRKNQADQIQGMEADLLQTQDPNQKVRIPQIIATLKKDIENWATSEQEAQGRVIDAETQVRNEQAKHDALEATLEKIDKELENPGKR